MADINKRKMEHVNLCASGEVGYQKATGFDDYDFIHNALPEINYDEVDVGASLLGRKFSLPVMISSMTGGYTEAGSVNAIIAEFCEACNLPFGVGSQRIMLEQPETEHSFSVVREKAPTAFIAANIGGTYLIDTIGRQRLERMIHSIEADAVIVHLNPLQELMQPEGDRNFKGVLAGIQDLVERSPVPVIVKETGAGLSGTVGSRLIEAGVSVLDTSGSGGTSWASVENQRSRNDDPKPLFDNWGLPTVVSLSELNSLKQRNEVELIASGGIRSSHDIIKALCMGADFTAVAQPIIKTIKEEGMEGLEALYATWSKQMRITLCLLGIERIDELDMKVLRTV